MKIIKIVATRCQILRLKCTKFNFSWGSAPDPAGEAYSAPSDPLAGFKGPTSKGEGKRGSGWSGWVQSTFFCRSMCTGADNQTIMKRKYAKHKMINLTKINGPSKDTKSAQYLG